MKFCQSCGAQLEDDAVFCTSCGSNQNATPAPQAPVAPTPVNEVVENVQPAPSVNPYEAFAAQNPYANLSAPAPKKSKKGLYIGLGIGAAVIVLALVLIFFVFGGSKGGSSPEDLAKKYVKALNSGDTDDLVNLFYPDTISKEDANSLTEVLGLISGIDYSISFVNVTDKDLVNDGDRLKIYQSQFNSKFDKNVKLSEYCELKFNMRLKMSFLGQTYDETEEVEIACVKIDGTWYLVDAN